MAKIVMIVEDNPLNLKLMRDILEAIGVETVESEDGRNTPYLARRTPSRWPQGAPGRAPTGGRVLRIAIITN